MKVLFLALNRVPQKDLGKYGVVASSKALSDKLYCLEDIVEKPLKKPTFRYGRIWTIYSFS